MTNNFGLFGQFQGYSSSLFFYTAGMHVFCFASVAAGIATVVAVLFKNQRTNVQTSVSHQKVIPVHSEIENLKRKSGLHPKIPCSPLKGFVPDGIARFVMNDSSVVAKFGGFYFSVSNHRIVGGVCDGGCVVQRDGAKGVDHMARFGYKVALFNCEITRGTNRARYSALAKSPVPFT